MSSEKRSFRTATFGKRLAQARARLQLSQEALAEAISTTSRSIIRWEQGQTFPQQYHWERLCNVLQTTPEQLFGVSNEEQPSASPSVPLWYVPYARNPYFIGREAMLNNLHEKLHTEQCASSAQRYAISGLGGIGKTQIALEYAYRFRGDYQAVLWIGGETAETLLSDYFALAHLFDLPEKESTTYTVVREAVKRWFQSYPGWLLIFDNVEDLELLSTWLPDTYLGHTLITTRSQITGTFGLVIDVQKMDVDEGTLFLLHRAKLLNSDQPLEEISVSELAQVKNLVQILDGLPLAIDQAGAYIEETMCSISDYLEYYGDQRAFLLDNRGITSSHHPASVSTTLSLAFQQVERASPISADLLRVCAFLYAEGIPEEFFVKAEKELGPILQSLANDPLLLNTSIRDLRRFSLLHRESKTRTLSVHRLLQAIIQDRMNDHERQQWMERIVQAMLRIFPNHRDVTSYEFGTQSDRQRYLPHALACTTLLKEWKIISPTAGELFYRIANYLQQSWGRNQQSLPFLFQAIDIAQQSLGKNHPSTALYLHVLGVFSTKEKLYSQSERYLQQALEIREKVKGFDHPDVAETLESLANLSCAQGEYLQALRLVQRALTIREQALGTDHYRITLTLNALGNIFMIQGEYMHAEQAFQRALLISKRTIGLDHFFAGFLLKSLGITYFLQKEIQKALDVFQQAFQIFEQKSGPNHPLTTSTLVRLGNIATAQQHYQQADAFYQKALSLYEKHLIPEASQVAYCHLSLGELHLSQKNIQLTKHHVHQLHLILGGTPYKAHIDYQEIMRCYLLLADYKANQGDLMQAHLYYRQALIMGEQKLELDHPLITHCRNTINNILH